MAEDPAVAAAAATAAAAAPGAEGLASRFLALELELSAVLEALPFGEPVSHVYAPLRYAWQPHEDFVRRYCGAAKRVLFLGMNPGPFGMAQTGVPFGDAWHVREWLQVTGRVEKPPSEHPKRPVLGLECRQAEVSGTRFWGLVRALCPDPRRFFRHCFVHNHCPLLFVARSGRNVTPAELPASQRARLLGALPPSHLEGFGHLQLGPVVVGTRWPQNPRNRPRNVGWAPKTLSNGGGVSPLLSPSRRFSVSRRIWQKAVRRNSWSTRNP
uniref:Single-strand-selective monofunctional uracil-DNA glycosylase 1 n=1 Tax=Apteryx owenii TaxID=8824 RepID=A0A8B9S3E5_APTOW